MKTCEVTFATVVADYIEEKRATGYRFTKEAQVLRRIVEQLQGTILPCLDADLFWRDAPSGVFLSPRSTREERYQTGDEKDCPEITNHSSFPCTTVAERHRHRNAN